jgi:RNA polymerase sigma-70 factor, ECF subfamily
MVHSTHHQPLTAAPAAQVWAEFSAPLRSFVAKRVPSWVDVDDVIQDVFLRIHQRLPELRDSERIDAWIFQIARNVLADSFRTHQRRDAMNGHVGTAEPTTTLGDDRAAAEELARCVAPMIAQLAEPYREAIELTEVAGLTQAEAAARIGLSISGMKSRVQRGREQLKGLFLECCRIDLDVRGGVVDWSKRESGTFSCGDSLRPSDASNDSMGMQTQSTSLTIATSDETKIDVREEAAGCCGGPAETDATACCALDEESKAAGEPGCGCEPAPTPTQTRRSCCS